MTTGKKPACPICGRPPEEKYRPFFTKRCADVDLGRWFNERYVVPEPIDPESEDLIGTGDDED